MAETRRELSSLDLTSLLVGHTALTLLASLSSSPAWNVPLALYGLVTVQRLDGANGAEAARTFVAVTGASMLLDFIWFVSNSTHGLARILILLNFFLKPITLMSTLSQLSSRGEGFSSGNFSLPGGLADRISGGFPPFGGQSGHGQSETVWSAPQQHTAPPGSYQGRFSLDDDLEGGGAGSGASTPSTLGKKVSLHTGQQVPAKQAAKTPLPPPSSSTSAAEGGGYHSLA
ncbi:hypothetical protein JCM8547_000966 [Rhodosporidiobolus lusitaniae]